LWQNKKETAKKGSESADKTAKPKTAQNTPSFPFLVDPQVTSNLGAMDGNNQQSNKKSFKTKS
jgi:hypothetical protein